MRKKFFSGCLALLFFLSIGRVNAASTCDYSEQVQLNNAAGSIRANYEINRILTDIDGNVYTQEEVNEILGDTVGDDSFAYQTEAKVYILNITNDVYVQVTGDNGVDKAYYYADSDNGVVEFDAGDLSKIVNYKITVYSNSERCKGDNLRNIDLTIPMINENAYLSGCLDLPNLSYCQEYITTPFTISDSEIQKIITDEYMKYRDSVSVEEEQEDKSFWDNVQEFFQKYKVVILSIVVIVIFIGVAATVWVIKKRRSRIL